MRFHSTLSVKVLALTTILIVSCLSYSRAEQIYWTSGASSDQGQIKRVDLDGSGLTTILGPLVRALIHMSEPTRLLRISDAGFGLEKKKIRRKKNSFFCNDTGTTGIYTEEIVGSVR